MKKIIIAIVALVVVAGGGFLVYQNLPEKRYSRHLEKARLFAKQGNLVAAHKEYESAYNARGKYTPYASLEVVRFENMRSLRENKIHDAINNTRKFLDENPDSKEGNLILAQLAFQAGELETAFSAVHIILTKEPAHFQARLMMAQVRASQGRPDLAEEQIRVLYQANPDSLNALLPLAETLLKQGKAKEARQFLLQALQDHPTNRSARLFLVDTWLQERQADSAHAALVQWRALDSTAGMAIDLRRARLHLLLDQHKQAEALLGTYRERSKENLAAFSELALIKARQGEYDSAIALYHTIADLNPAAKAGINQLVYLLHLRLGNAAQALELAKVMELQGKNSATDRFTITAYLAMGQEHRAVELINQRTDTLKMALSGFMAQIIPDKNFIGTLSLADYFTLNQQTFAAFQAIEQLHKQWPQNQLAQERYLQHLMQMNRLPEAIALMEKMSKPAPMRRLQMAEVYLRVGQPQKALTLVGALHQEFPDLNGLNALQGDIYMSMKNQSQAVAYYEKELQANPGHVVALNNLAWHYGAELRDLEKARPYITKLESLNLKDPRILDTIGWILALNGELESAAGHLELALNLIPDHPDMLYHMAWVKVKMGETEAGHTLARQALASGKDFPSKAEALQLVAQ